MFSLPGFEITSFPLKFEDFSSLPAKETFQNFYSSFQLGGLWVNIAVNLEKL
jgi:hypothetical protein